MFVVNDAGTYLHVCGCQSTDRAQPGKGAQVARYTVNVPQLVGVLNCHHGELQNCCWLLPLFLLPLPLLLPPSLMMPLLPIGTLICLYDDDNDDDGSSSGNDHKIS